ncbi:MAG: DUF4199 domain-containing protein [Mucilaginibacter sp.]|uniref:DUF4199 domain-containing protein n=1 Tax=Mucilaginibacter sp. TaxID=1882438 RepID=UPI0031A418C7
MKKNVLVFGTISGVLVAGWMVISMAWCYNRGIEGSMLVGYASMILAFSLIFVGVKNYRDKYNGGIISFGKAFQIGLYISLIASTIYVLAWLVEYYVFMPDFMDRYTAHAISKAQNSGANPAELAAKLKEINSMKDMYSTPLMVILFTYMEIFPVGLLVSIITALILKRKSADSMATVG